MNESVTNASVAVNLTSCFHGDDKFKYFAYTLTYSLLFPVAFLSNLGALVVFILQRKERSASSMVMLNMALSDLSFSLTLPFRLVYYSGEGIWSFPDWLCRLCVYGFYVNLYTSILFLTLLSMLRWHAVVHPTQHRSKATPNRILFVCVGIWLFVGGTSSLFLAHGVVYRGGIPRCFEVQRPSSWLHVLVLNYLAVLLGFLLPFVIIICSYSFLLNQLSSRPASLRVRRESSVMQHRQHHQRSLSLVTTVCVTFLLFFFPYHTVRTVHLHAVCEQWSCGAIVMLQRLVVVTLCLAASNSAVNPLLYYYCTQNFREKLKKTGTKIKKFVEAEWKDTL